MLYLKSWLQEYIKQSLPENDIIVESLNSKAFEVEDLQSLNNDFIFDIKVLPNRASDCLCHRAMAREIAACLDLDFVCNHLHTSLKLQENMTLFDKVFVDRDFDIKIKDNKACTRFAGVLVEGITVQDSPLWLQQKLSSIGQKSINNIVDITNFVQFAINKPMHAYDYKNIEGDINVRFASDGEVLETLDDRNLLLDNNTLIIADDKKALGLAGIKGGKYSGISLNTNSIFIESANFNNTLIRKTSQKYNLRTDASKRFESRLSDNLVIEGIYLTLNILLLIAREQGFIESIKISNIKDIFPSNGESAQDNLIDVSLDDINLTLGLSASDNNILNIDNCIAILNKLNIKVIEHDDYVLKVKSPINRLDLNIKEDIIEEIGRINGFIKIKPRLPNIINRNTKINNYLLVENFIKDIFIKYKFFLVYNYSFRAKGEVKVIKPLSEDKSFLRSDLTSGLIECLEKNIINLPLIDVQDIRVFEFGNVFSKDKEERRLAFAIADNDKKSNFSQEIQKILIDIKQVLKDNLAINIDNFEEKYIIEQDKSQISNQFSRFLVEINIESIMQDNIEILKNIKTNNIYYPDYQEKLFDYIPFAVTPFVIRDIAFWSKSKLSELELDNIMINIKQNAGQDSKNIKLFDSFEKDFDGVKKYSYAYRIIYQNKDKTLTDQEVNMQAQKVYDYLTSQSFEIR